ncbi:hypothetical protein FRACYDRAFT_247539 [Fragilariopsis cylindrus CCMP1102]|uniref:F-box domain-containing protein n=1 Tax=Fragilariopsis cylindrus CCMP1102 TaxID=635003 RepID=A0A1E7EX61_9STRA|nr:hypothetical protein FRACYDRAFT_247539 [Fragilariopsis cylindrus CCMP1102]|eukprot:OEU10437.1 hypothetical protein FRACYDRAFT_247539 [Fragilariopsis cylindrus CCMP1102]
MNNDNDSLPYVETVHANYEEYALALIKEEMKASVPTRSLKKMPPLNFRTSMMQKECESLLTTTCTASSEAAAADAVTDGEEGNKLFVALFSPGLPLTKLMSYLEPCDILNCIQTCKKWKIDMNKDEIWHEVLVANNSFSSRNGALDAIINSNTTTTNDNNNTQEENENNTDDATMITAAAAAAAKSNSKSNSNTSNSNINSKFNYRNMAIAMYRKMNDYEEGIPQTFPKSKLNLKDVFVVIEIRDRWLVIPDNDDLMINNYIPSCDYSCKSKQLGSFCSDLTELTENKPGHSKYISYDSAINNNNRNNCFSDTFLQTKIDDDDMPFENLEMSSRLIRHDTGKCIVLNDYECVRNYKKGSGLGFIGCFGTENGLEPKGKGGGGQLLEPSVLRQV